MYSTQALVPPLTGSSRQITTFKALPSSASPIYPTCDHIFPYHLLQVILGLPLLCLPSTLSPWRALCPHYMSKPLSAKFPHFVLNIRHPKVTLDVIVPTPILLGETPPPLIYLLYYLLPVSKCPRKIDFL